MGESIATDGAKGLLQLVAARASDEINLAWGLKGQLGKLNTKIEYIQAFLEDAGNAKHDAQTSHLINLWVRKIKDATYSAEDVMDEYAIEIFRRKIELKNRFTKKFRNFFTLYNPVFFRFRMAHKVNDILSLFDKIDKEAKIIGLNQVDIAAKAVADANCYENNLADSRKHAGLDASEFVGREYDQAKLLDFICGPTKEGHGSTNKRHDLSTMAIVGMGGFGKTTLARRLFNHERIDAQFGDNKIWISVPQKFEITKLLNEMLQSVTSVPSELSNTDTIIRKLQENLTGKRLLLVFDDVWHDDEHSWGSLKGLLHKIGTASGSVILVTTRSDLVAKAAKVVFKHKLKGLLENESWLLFQRIVFNDTTRPNHSHWQEIGRRIIKKCNGVPLAIKVIGGLLRSKQLPSEWESIDKNELWDLPHDENQILPWLLLSYNHLPSPSLKQCFAYCAITTKGDMVLKSELFGYWLSQGYLRNDKRNLMAEDIGEEYLKILLSNSLLQEVKLTHHEGYIWYQMHDLVYDLAVYVSGNDLITDPKDLRKENRSRHLLFLSEEDNTASNSPSEEQLRNLRTVLFKGSVSWNMLLYARHLRSLFLCFCGIIVLPPSIGLLKHLRLLDVSHNPIATLSDTIGKLYQLQTLVLQGCKNMKKLPKVVNKLVNLRHISTTAPLFACKGLKQLTNLQNLPGLCLDDDQGGWSIDELEDLDQLRDVINIQGLEYVIDKDQARKAMLGRKAKVTKLNLSWVEVRGESSGVSLDEGVLEALEPNPNITSLTIQNFNGEKFPTWILRMDVLIEGLRRTQLNNLTEIKLQNCKRCQTLPTLGQLPLLKCLVLAGLDVKCIGIEFYGSEDLQANDGESFQSLLELDISEFLYLVTWILPPQGAFPRLEALRVRHCHQLEALPAMGTKSLLSVELLHLYRLESLNIIKNAVGLTSLVINFLVELTNLPRELAACRRLQTLKIYNCDKLMSLPFGFKSYASLRSLEVRFCNNIKSLPGDLFHQGLSTMEFVGCTSLRISPTDMERCSSLETFRILGCPMMKASPSHISKLQRLSQMSVSYHSAEQLRSVLGAAQPLPLLMDLQIEGFKDEEEMRDYFSDITPFLRLPSLKVLILYGKPNIKTLPQQLERLTRITELQFWDFVDLEEIPDWISNLSFLESLGFIHCHKLKQLPSKEVWQRLSKLRLLSMNECPQLVERYAKDNVPEWHIISHIPYVKIDGKIIENSED